MSDSAPGGPSAPESGDFVVYPKSRTSGDVTGSVTPVEPGAELTEHDLGWLYGLAKARVKKQRKRLDNYEARKGDDTYHFDELAVNLTRMEDTLARLEKIAPPRWKWENNDV